MIKSITNFFCKVRCHFCGEYYPEKKSDLTKMHCPWCIASVDEEKQIER